MGEWLTIAMDDGYAMPVWHVAARGERRGGLVLVQEIFGVTEHIRELCDEYAADGYEVLSPGLFDREEPGYLLLSGEAGVGKTRLAQEVTTLAARTSFAATGAAATTTNLTPAARRIPASSTANGNCGSGHAAGPLNGCAPLRTSKAD